MSLETLANFAEILSVITFVAALLQIKQFRQQRQDLAAPHVKCRFTRPSSG